MNFRHNIIKAYGLLCGGMLLLGASSCSLMHDDLMPCAVKPTTRTTVRFVYDYNTADRDMFAEAVGGVTLYVFDADGKLVESRDFSNVSTGNALKLGNFKVDFNSTEIQPEHRYTFYAVAHGHESGYSGAITLPGAAFHRTELERGIHSADDYIMMLDRDGDGIVDHDGVMIDALWMTRTPVTVDVPEEREPEEGDMQEEDHQIDVTVPLTRVTNTVTVTFFERDFPSYIDPSMYEISVVAASGAGKLTITGQPLDNRTLSYKPVRTWTCMRQIDGINTACVTAEFGGSRLMIDGNVKLEIKSRLTGKTTTLANLPLILARGNEAFAEKCWPSQEYLDRQYEYELDLPLGDEVPKWVQLNIGILSWSKRIQTENL